MKRRIPQVSGHAVIKLLEKHGYAVVRQRGSHVRMARDSSNGGHHITIPLHHTVAKGTLNDILAMVSASTHIPRDELIEQVK